jgi:hypothetical protein
VNAVINGKKYTVQHVFNMVGNWEFTDKNGIVYLVDGQDVSIFGGAGDCFYEHDGTDTDGTEWYLCTMHDELAPSQDAPCAKWVNNPNITAHTAIEYAQQLAADDESGVFWWKVKKA